MGAKNRGSHLMKGVVDQSWDECWDYRTKIRVHGLVVMAELRCAGWGGWGKCWMGDVGLVCVQGGKEDCEHSGQLTDQLLDGT